MKFRLIVRYVDDVVILDASGEFALGLGTSEFRNEVSELLDAGCNRILLNLAGVTRLDSSAIGEMVSAHCSVSNAGGQMKLLKLTKPARDVLTIARLHTVFEVFEDETNAILSFSPLRRYELPRAIQSVLATPKTAA